MFLILHESHLLALMMILKIWLSPILSVPACFDGYSPLAVDEAETALMSKEKRGVIRLQHHSQGKR